MTASRARRLRPAESNSLGDDRGSTIPLIIGFFLLGLLMIAGSIALGEAFVQQRDLQDVCDGAAAAAAASAADLGRENGTASGSSLRFTTSRQAIDAYLARDADRRTVRVETGLSADASHLELTCVQTRPLTLGALFGKAHVRHVAHSSSRAAVRD